MTQYTCSYMYMCKTYSVKFYFKDKYQWGTLVCSSKKACRNTVTRICTLEDLIVLGFV